MLVGRTREFEEIERFVAAARDGGGPVLTLLGPAGIGKTALLETVRASAPGCSIVSTTATSSGAELPYVGLLDLCLPLLGHLIDLPDRQAGALEAALALGPIAAGDDLAVALALHGVLRAEAALRPTLVLVDDAHWLDVDSARCLEFLVPRLGSAPIGLLLAAREDELPPWMEPLPALRPAPLDRDDARALVRAVAADLNPAAVDAVLEVAGGNPLALLDLPPSLVDERRVGGLAPREPLPLGRRLQRTYEERLADLEPDARGMILLAAAAETASVADLGRAGEQLGVDATALRGLEDLGLLSVHDGRVAITHPLVRSAAYHRASPAERREAHGALGAVLPPPSRAWHRAAAAEGPDEAAAAEMDAAGRAAQGRSGYAAAGRSFHRAAELSPAGVAHDERLLWAALAALAGGELAVAKHWLGEVGEPTEDGPLRSFRDMVRAFVMRAEAQTVRASITVFADLGERMSEPAPDRATDAFADGALSAILVGDLTTALALAQRGRARLDEATPPATRCPVLATLTFTLIAAGRVADARPIIEELDAVVAELDAGSPSLRGVPLSLLARGALGDLDALAERTRALAQATGEAGAYKPGALLLAVEADLAYRRGAWAQSEEIGQEAVALFRQLGQPMGLYYALSVEARLRAARGEREQAHRLADEVLAACAPPGSDLVAAQALGAIGLLELGLGNAADAIERFGVLAERLADSGLEDPSILPWRADLVEALARAGRREQARAVLVELERQAATSESAYGHAMAARGRGLLADQDFEEHFATALVWHDRQPMPFERACTELSRGVRLRRANRRADARGPLRSAREGFRALGAAPWAEQATEELRAAGGRVRGPRAATTVLTDRERRVALAASTGATNREIAAELFVSVKTVEAHLARVFDKLGVRTRGQLAGRLPDP